MLFFKASIVKIWDMPVTKSAKKKLRVDVRRRAVNKPVLSRMKTLIKRLRSSKDPKMLSSVYSAIDIAKKKNIIKKSKAARLKSRLSKFVAKLKPKSKK